MLKLLLAIVIFILTTVGWQLLVRELANNGKFWVRVPEMTALAIMRDRALHEILVICPNTVWKELEICCDITPENMRTPQSTLRKIFCLRKIQIGGNKIIRLRKGLYFIGVPWVYQVYRWYLTATDKANYKIKPLHSLTLSVMNIVYETEETDPLNGVINLLTADGIEVQAKLTYYLTVRHPEKALFNIEHIKTFIRDLIIPAWRDVLSKFQFFQYEELLKADTPKEYLISAMTDLNKDLRDRLGIPEERATRENFSELVKSFKGVAKVLYDEGGIITENITLSEFDPVRKEVDQALENILIAKTEAQAAIQIATGKKRVDQLGGEGKKQKLDALGEEAHFILAIEAYEKATENLGKVQTLVLDIKGIFGPILEQLQVGLGKK